MASKVQICKFVGDTQLEKMEKENEVRQVKPTASFTGWSVAFNIIFALNLATTPFMAYLTEPRPGQTLPSTLPASMSFDEYVNHTSAYLQQLYNHETLSSSLKSPRPGDEYLWHPPGYGDAGLHERRRRSFSSPSHSM
ncbi:unnamed protein product [Aphanomyces euteiches]